MSQTTQSNNSHHSPAETMDNDDDDPILKKLHAKGMDKKDYNRHKKLPRASILVPLFWSKEANEWHVLLTQRPMHLNSHPGEVCFPGGRQEEHDKGDDIATALRETHEEVGIDISNDNVVTPICRMETCESVNGLCVTPIVAVLHQEIDPLALDLCPKEVEAAFCVPLSYFWNEDNCDSKQEVEWRGGSFVMRHYYYKETVSRARTFKIWGLTAHVIYEVAKWCKPTPNDKGVIKGYLYRWMDETTGRPYWAKRYFILNPAHKPLVLHQYENERKASLKSDTATKKNRLLLDNANDCKVVLEESDDKVNRNSNNNAKHAFSISVLEGRIQWKLAASTKEERDKWVSAIIPLRNNDSAVVAEGQANKKQKSSEV